MSPWVQWLQKLRSRQPQDPAFDACIAATCEAVLSAVARHGLRALQSASVAAAIACIAHRPSAAFIMSSLLASPHCRDAPGKHDTGLMPYRPAHDILILA